MSGVKHIVHVPPPSNLGIHFEMVLLMTLELKKALKKRHNCHFHSYDVKVACGYLVLKGRDNRCHSIYSTHVTFNSAN